MAADKYVDPIAGIDQGTCSSMATDNYGDLLGAIDQGTCSSRFVVFSSRTGESIAMHQIETELMYPQEGWVEMDAKFIYESVKQCIAEVVLILERKNIDPKRIKCVGISDQMITVTMWDKFTGEPFYNSIVWSDSRCCHDVEEALSRIPGRNKDYFRERIGHPVAAYFNYMKVPWLIRNNEKIRTAIKENRCLYGTVDTWLLWNLTGGPNGGEFKTDLTNVGHSGLLNLTEVTWDTEVCKFFNIPSEILPTIHSTSEIFGYIADGPLAGIPISGVSVTTCAVHSTNPSYRHSEFRNIFNQYPSEAPGLTSMMIGDQLGATVGQMCFKPGQSKCTYGTGGCIIVNTDTKPVYSHKGLMTWPLYKLRPDAPAIYSLAGGIQVAGQVVRWLRDNLGLIKDSSEIETLASSVDSTHDCYFVPALQGYFFPFWQDDARGVIVGISNYTKREHIARAALEAVAYQIKQAFDAISEESGHTIRSLRVDGGMIVNNLLMQFQCDLIGVDLIRPHMKETSALGAAIMAGAADGIDIFKTNRDRKGIDVKFEVDTDFDVFKPQIDENERKRKVERWLDAVERSLHWKTK